MAEEHRKLIEKTCVVCKSVFMARPFSIKKGWAKSCSKSCANSLRAKKKHMDNPQNGENNPAWKGGVSIQSHRCSVAVSKAIKAGKLERGMCEQCGTNKDVHGHHCDYNKPLEVMWLCRKHHNEWHRNNEPIYCST